MTSLQFLHIFCLFSLLLLLPSPIDAIGHIDLHIRKLLLRKTPPGCCTNDMDCLPPSHQSACPLNFRLCIGVAEPPAIGIVQARKECLILARNFSLTVHNTGAADNRLFTVLDLPIQRFNFTSTAIDSKNIFIELSIWSGDGDKLLLFSRQYTSSPLNVARERSTFEYAAVGNLLVYQLHFQCAPGFVGSNCAIFCEPPLPSDNHICTPSGIQCLPGWSGTRCGQPICDKPCTNGGRCIAPNRCACPTGWEGPQCAKCKPRADCKNGFCTDEPGKCFCLPNWTGPNCNLVVNKCLERPCKNGGRCTTNGKHGNYFHCYCPPGYIGPDCAISYSVCKNASCGPNQRCAPLEKGYTCVCDPGFEGPHCYPKQQQYGGQTGKNGNPSKNNTIQSALQPPVVPPPHNQSEQSASDFGTLKTWVCGCFFLLLLVVAILCCGHQHPPNSLPFMACCCPPRALRDRTTPPELGNRRTLDEEEDEMASRIGRKEGGGPTSIRIQPGRGNNVHWRSSSSANDFDDELDSGVGSIHSAQSPIGHNDSQQHRRLVNWSSSTTRAIVTATGIPSPPPSYEESIQQQQTCNSAIGEAFV